MFYFHRIYKQQLISITSIIDCQVLTLGCEHDNYCFYFDLEFITKYSGH